MKSKLIIFGIAMSLFGGSPELLAETINGNCQLTMNGNILMQGECSMVGRADSKNAVIYTKDGTIRVDGGGILSNDFTGSSKCLNNFIFGKKRGLSFGSCSPLSSVNTWKVTEDFTRKNASNQPYIKFVSNLIGSCIGLTATGQVRSEKCEKNALGQLWSISPWWGKNNGIAIRNMTKGTSQCLEVYKFSNKNYLRMAACNVKQRGQKWR